MRYRSLALAACLIIPSVAALAADAPAIKSSDDNPVPACVTPGRLTAYLKSRNSELDPRFDKIAVQYMRRGEELGLRWDYTFYQMLLETGYLSYQSGSGRRGDVKPSQFNFAGLGATGRGNPGESFPDLETGVLAHLQHVQLYAGDTVKDPVAERTRKVQEWGVLDSLKKKRGPITFVHLAQKWAPGSGSYIANLKSLEAKFNEDFCGARDPHPEWVAMARGKKPAAVAQAAPEKPAAETTTKVSGADLARRAIEEGKANDNNRSLGLGAGGLAKAMTPSYSVLNKVPEAKEPEAAPPAQAVESAKKPDKAAVVTASAAGQMAKAGAAAQAGSAASAAKCRVWTASYGGLKALIIRVKSTKGVDYTVLDVNEGAEKREADAYISAYAKGGEIAGEFQSQTQALDKAFEMCPEN